MSNEAELRQLYDAYLGRMRPGIIDRLRRHHAADFRAGRDLATYVKRKNLAFLAFDTDWILTRETLEMGAVEAHVSSLVAETLGEDVAVELPVYRRVVEANRKAVREVAVGAAPVIGVWCQRNDVPLPEPWQQSEAQAVARHLENSGLLDFELIGSADIPGLCRRAGCWPDGMPETLDGETLGLTRDDVKVEEKRRERERQQREIERRSILFAGTSLDTGDPKFAENLQELAARFIENDETWFERSRQRTRLLAFDNPDQPGGGAGGAGTGGGTRVLELPNPMGEATRNRFTTVGRGSVRLRFERR